MALATSPALAAEVTLQPLARFPLDAAILFSDILTIPDAMGLGLSFAEGEGPRFARTVRDEAAVRALAVPDMAKLAYVFDAVALIKRELRGRVPLIGFAGSPFTLACYMIEGGGSADFATVRKMAYARPDLLAQLVAVNARAVSAYLDAQIESGADAVMVFDTWGGLLTADAYRRFSLGPMRDVLATLSARKGRTGPEHRVHQGWRRVARRDRGVRRRRGRTRLDRRPARRARRRRRTRGAAGQPRPAACSSPTRPPSRAKRRPSSRAAGPAPGHIFNLGHGIVPGTPPENVAALVEAVHATSRASRAAA